MDNLIRNLTPSHIFYFCHKCGHKWLAPYIGKYQEEIKCPNCGWVVKKGEN